MFDLYCTQCLLFVLVFSDCTVRTTVGMRSGTRRMKNERTAVERGQQSTTEEHGQHKLMATKYVSTRSLNLVNMTNSECFRFLLSQLSKSSEVILSYFILVLYPYRFGLERSGINRGNQRHGRWIFLYLQLACSESWSRSCHWSHIVSASKRSTGCHPYENLLTGDSKQTDALSSTGLLHRDENSRLGLMF